MHYTLFTKVQRWLMAAAAALVFSGCGATPLQDAPPTQFDLSGRWLLQADLSDAPPNPRKLGTAVLPPEPNRQQRSRQARRQAGSLAFVAHDFPVMHAKRMTIEQSADSMGIDYDRGRYRDLSWGERERGLWTINTGWNEAGELVSRWRADDAVATETFALADAGKRLTVLLDVSTGNDSIKLRRVYRKLD